MAVNKVIYNGSTIIDISEDTVASDKLLSGYTAHDKSGIQINGTHECDSSGGLIPSSIVAGNTPALASWTGSKVSATTATDTGLSLTIQNHGTYRFKIPYFTSASYGSGSSCTVYIYKNGSQLTSGTAATSPTSPLSFDVQCSSGDVISVYAAGTGSGYSATAITVLCLIGCIDWSNGF